MKLKDVLMLSMTSIRHRNLRSWLTILGIVIGVASIISLIGISLGISSQISSRLNTIGSNIITISAGGQQAERGGGGFGLFRPPQNFRPGGNFGGGESSTPQVTFRDADSLRTVTGVLKVDARVQSRQRVSYKDQNTSLTVVGTEPASFPDSVGIPLYSGRYLSTSDQYSAVLGFSVANSTFKDLAMLNRQIKINGISFRVVGMLNQSGSGGFGSSDNNIFIPQKIAKSMFNQTTAASSVIIVASPNYDVSAVASNVEDEMLVLHRVTTANEDFTITTAATLQSAVSGITDTLGLLLGGIASISLLVGAIGVANTMFMSVLEQTKDIGVLKSLGAKNSDVVNLFLCEAGIIGFVGGVLGIVLSLIVAYILGTFSVPIILTLELLLGGLFFSVIIGIIAGIAPARNAASIPPVEALKYE